MSQVAKSSLIVTVFTAFGLGLAFLSNVVIAAKFGAGKNLDVFLAATTLPLFITSILSGSLSFTFIPVFAEYRAKDPGEIWKVVSSFINLNVVVTTVLCLIGILFANTIMKALAPGFTEEKLVRSTELLRWLFPIIILAVINELMAGVYYSNQRFLVPSLNKTISPLITIAYVLLFHGFLSTKSIVLAMLTATFIQSALLIIGFFRTHDFNYSFVFDYKHPGVIKILKLMTPLVLGMVIYRGITIFDRFVLSLLPEGNISILNYSTNIVSALPPLIITGISTAIFPKLSDYFSSGNIELLKQKLEEVLRFLILVTVPIIIFITFYAGDLVRIIFERGSFGHAITLKVAEILSFHITILLPIAVGTILGQCFYVAQRTKIAAILGVSEAVFYMIICYPLAMYLGIKGLIYATMVDWYLSLFVSVIAVSKILSWNPKSIGFYLVKIISVGLVLSGILIVLRTFNASVYFAGPCFIVIYYIAVRALSLNNELKWIEKLVINKFFALTNRDEPRAN